MSWFRDDSADVQDVGGLPIKRGTAMGPLVPWLILTPFILGFAWLLRSVAMVSGVPLISALLVVAALAVVFGYHRRYAWFAKHDPDRLQSEWFRYEMARMRIAAKELQQPAPADRLFMADPAVNPVNGVKSRQAESKNGERTP